MGIESVIVWKGKSDALYHEARRLIITRNGAAPKTIKDIDFGDFFGENKNTLVYFPVFQATTGWWGEILGTEAKIQSKIIVSPECQLYEIGHIDNFPNSNESIARKTAHQLYAAEITPKNSLFTKLHDTAITVKDMIATDSGTILALLTGGSEDKIRNCIRSTGGQFYGNLGGY